MKQTERLRAIARRTDVWLPDLGELHHAWGRLHPAPEARPVIRIDANA